MANNLGEVVGITGDMYPPSLYSGGEIQLLGNFQGIAYDINDLGQIVGYATRDYDSSYGPFLYSGGAMQELAFPGAAFSVGAATGINNNGDVVGWVGGFDAASEPIALGVFLYSAGTMQIIDDAFSGTFAINNHRQIAGHFTNGGFLYSDGAVQPPPTQPGAHAYRGIAINDRGGVVGTMDVGTSHSNYHAFLYRD